jgi:hypothetical protein
VPIERLAEDAPDRALRNVELIGDVDVRAAMSLI